MRPVLAFGIPIATAALAAATAVGAQAYYDAHLHECRATQPVYTQAAPYVQVGSWEARLRPGQTVLLPDGDTAVCTLKGLFIQ